MGPRGLGYYKDEPSTGALPVYFTFVEGIACLLAHSFHPWLTVSSGSDFLWMLTAGLMQAEQMVAARS